MVSVPQREKDARFRDERGELKRKRESKSKLGDPPQMVPTDARGDAIGASRVSESTIMRLTFPRWATVEGDYAVHACAEQALAPPLLRHCDGTAD